MAGNEATDCLSSYSAVAGMLTKKVVVVHPIVLLSVVDHFNRIAKGTSRRVVGCVLGEVVGDEWHATNSCGGRVGEWDESASGGVRIGRSCWRRMACNKLLWCCF
ncbi:hypothetical protein, conserved, partial [Eimeria tenella]